MARVEFAEQGRDPEVAHRVRCGNAQPASRSTLQLAYRTFRLVEIARNALAMLEIDVAGLGQSELAGCAVQQLCAQSLFQLMHLAADRGLGQVQRAGSGSEARSEEHTSELQSLMRISYAVFCLKKKKEKPKARVQILTT